MHPWFWSAFSDGSLRVLLSNCALPPRALMGHISIPPPQQAEAAIFRIGVCSPLPHSGLLQGVFLNWDIINKQHYISFRYNNLILVYVAKWSPQQVLSPSVTTWSYLPPNFLSPSYCFIWEWVRTAARLGPSDASEWKNVLPRRHNQYLICCLCSIDCELLKDRDYVSSVFVLSGTNTHSFVHSLIQEIFTESCKYMMRKAQTLTENQTFLLQARLPWNKYTF